MTAKYDPDLIDRLAREARDGYQYPTNAADAIAILVRRVDLSRAMADQLEAARMEVERWKALAEYHCGAQNREVEPCEDGSCSHSYDSWPVGSVTKHAREVDQCDDCGWTAVQVDAYRAAKGKT